MSSNRTLGLRTVSGPLPLSYPFISSGVSLFGYNTFLAHKSCEAIVRLTKSCEAIVRLTGFVFLIARISSSSGMARENGVAHRRAACASPSGVLSFGLSWLITELNEPSAAAFSINRIVWRTRMKERAG